MLITVAIADAAAAAAGVASSVDADFSSSHSSFWSHSPMVIQSFSQDYNVCGSQFDSTGDEGTQPVGGSASVARLGG